MDYSQFLSMIPEVALMAILIVVFAVDFFLKHHAEKGKMLYMTAALLTIAQSAVCLCAAPVEAFSGMYTSSLSVNLMKFILTAGTFVVIVMAQPWLNKKEMAALLYVSTFHLVRYVHDDVFWSFPDVLPWIGNGVSAHGMSCGTRQAEQSGSRSRCQVHTHCRILVGCNAFRPVYALRSCGYTLFH